MLAQLFKAISGLAESFMQRYASEISFITPSLRRSYVSLYMVLFFFFLSENLGVSSSKTTSAFRLKKNKKLFWLQIFKKTVDWFFLLLSRFWLLKLFALSGSCVFLQLLNTKKWNSFIIPRVSHIYTCCTQFIVTQRSRL